MWHFVLLIVCAVAIYLSCEWFVNAVEWLGERLNVGKMAVGTILAAFGTALPESVVTLVAVTTGSEDQKEIGVGAAMGGPLALATLAYGVTGVMLLWRKRILTRELITVGAGSGSSLPADDREMLGSRQDVARLSVDQRWFLVVFVFKVILGLVVFAWKPWLGVLFLAVYAVYVYKEMVLGAPKASAEAESEDEDDEEELEPLKLQPNQAVPASWAIGVQLAATLAVIFFASQIFVGQLDAIGPMIGLSGAVTALLLAPIATELPEIMNSIIWVRQGKAKLALANISGAMMIQVTVPSASAMIFADWHFDGALTWSAIVTMAAIGYLLLTMATNRLTPARLALAAVFYPVFAIGLFFIV
ncbi:sodium:calcium antiporter [Kineosporia babensis]|uniref:Sodium/calcium exchanger membrane region domain-containing protein n=1 Tax=Kineosporia babensis TaxID=499548 RepID=A0A9X1SV65_9ACTN|nr:hypothetical protein [Kineosporia babensis]